MSKHGVPVKKANSRICHLRRWGGDRREKNIIGNQVMASKGQRSKASHRVAQVKDMNDFDNGMLLLNV